MDNVDLNVLRQVAAWLEAGHKAVLGTVTRTWGSAPRPVGSVVAVRGDGVIAGSVSGGCIEDDLIEKVRQGALALAGHAEIVRYGVGAEEAQRFGLPCGGTMELVLEPVTAKSRIPELLARLGEGRRVRRVLDLASAEVRLAEPGDDDAVVLTDTTLASTHGPRWRLLLIGAGQLTQYLARMAQALDYSVVICDPREEYPDEPDLGVERVRTMPDDTVVAFRPDGHTAVIALTHDPKLDDLALMEALATNAFYVGAIGSRRTQAHRRERLVAEGVGEEELARIHGPAGLDVGAATPAETALAILAEALAARMDRSGRPLRGSAGRIHVEAD